MPYDKLKLENQLCFPLYACSKEIIKKYKPYLDPLGITYTQYIALMALWEEDNITVKELGKKLFLDSGTLTPLFKKMEAQKLVVRQRSSDDERNVYISLTEEGRKLRDRAVDIPNRLGSCIDLPMEEIVQLQKSLHKLLQQLV
ncbi:transcriptional regulator, MarR family [Ruminiclostridium papyrosolvens DSM 2782]|uniref:Transcriptional regulator, MarR family n=1 Tax=Ruminiclostridium papyrosolvens DSM 2782 TaxID=588581 RepID=F1TCS1_9FIRM|nr:MarR family transcriptional regulator [Ruminiclostridium papyrosolvens]EGD47788.1 transcriptional regulator, MarR family [Ruminiclostridium papyrosolvens DSM 2782]WES34505.1 MarR family transcriptional regulator [Ruminiclostridium papyrosolvens DSM 2782]